MKNPAMPIRFIRLLLNVLFWFLLLESLFYGLLSLRSCLNLLYAPDPSASTYLSGIKLNHLFISTSEAIPLEPESVCKMQLISLLIYLVQMPLICYGIQLMRKLLLPLSQSLPFSGTAKILSRLTALSLSIALVQNLAGWLLVYGQEHWYHLDTLLQGGIVKQVSFHFQLNWTFFICALVFFLLSWVFRYGEELQQLSDETI